MLVRAWRVPGSKGRRSAPSLGRSGLGLCFGPGVLPHNPFHFVCEIRYNVAVSLEKSIEGAIQEAMAAGAFKNLPGEGKPLVFDRLAEELAGENWLGFKMLPNNGYTPEWLSLGREIELDLEALAIIDRNHAEFCESAGSAADWARVAPAARPFMR